jgi:hypothetical protein
MVSYGGYDRDDFRNFMLSKEGYLKVEISVLLVGFGHAILPDKDKGRQENCFDGSKGAKNSEARIPRVN